MEFLNYMVVVFEPTAFLLLLGGTIGGLLLGATPRGNQEKFSDSKCARYLPAEFFVVL